MEVTAAVATKTYIETESLAERVKNTLTVRGMNITDLAKAISYDRSTISQYLSGKYKSNPVEIEGRLEEYLNSNVQSFEIFMPLSKPDSFFASHDAKDVIGVCQSCQEYVGLGIVVGRSGYGKTYALKHYGKLRHVAYIECDDTMGSRDLVEAIERSLGIPGGYGTIWKRVNGIRQFCSVNKGYLIIIDEADKLISKYTQKKMEILRAIFDQTNVGLIIAGEPRLEAQIKGYLPRMANRVDFYAEMRGLSGTEVEGFLHGYDIEASALAELKARACNMQTGCFRLLDRTLSNVFRILAERNERTITVKTIEQASSMMML